MHISNHPKKDTDMSESEASLNHSEISTNNKQFDDLNAKKKHAVQLAQQLTTLRKVLAPIEPFYQRTTLNRLLCKHFISSVDP